MLKINDKNSEKKLSKQIIRRFLTKSKQIIGRFLTKSKQIIGRFLTKSKEIIRLFLTKSKEIISPDLNNCDLLPIFVSANDILIDDI